MENWYMLTLVGRDRPGIVAHISGALFQGNCNLGEASMTRLGGNFSIMLMVRFDGSETALDGIIAPVCEKFDLRHHVDAIDGELHRHLDPNVRISVHGADRAGIVAQVTGKLAESGLNILNLESDVAGTEDNPIYIMHIEGVASEGVESLQAALDSLDAELEVDTEIAEIDILRG